MARTVAEVMNRELFHVAADETARRALDELLVLGISSAPVLDGTMRPVGVVSVRDLVKAPPHATVRMRMTPRPTVVGPHDTVEEAARRLVEGGLHHAPVVDAEGRAVGFLSVLDALAALIGMPARHPPMFPHYDAEVGVTWSDDQPLDRAHASAAPSGAGVIALVHGGAGLPERVVWAGACDDLRRFVDELVASGAASLGELQWLFEHGRLRFRWAAVADPADRERAAARAVERMRDDERRARLGI